MTYSGIYKISCSANGKFYIGSTRTNLVQRMSAHKTRLRNGIHDNLKMQSSWNKYGEAAFSFDIIETCEPEIAYDREQFYMDSLKTEFNNTKTAWPYPRIGKHKGLDGWIASQINATIEALIACNLLKEFCKHNSPVRIFFGLPAPQPRPESVKKKMREGGTGISRGFGVPKSPEHRAAQGAARKRYVARMKEAGMWPPSFYNKCKA